MTNLKIPHNTSHSPYAAIRGLQMYISILADLVRPFSKETQHTIWQALVDGKLEIHRENDIDGTVILEVVYA